MGFMNSFFEFFTNSLPGAILDTTMGRGGDGVPYSSAESFVLPEGAQQKTDIHINAENLELNAAAVNINQAAQDQAAQASNDNGAAAQSEAEQEAAFNAVMREQDEGLRQS